MISSIIKKINIMKSFQLIDSAFRSQKLQYKTNLIANFQLMNKVRQIISLIDKKKEIKEILANIRRFVNFLNYSKRTFYFLQLQIINFTIKNFLYISFYQKINKFLWLSFKMIFLLIFYNQQIKKYQVYILNKSGY
ncbi:transmembrane protein, putative (macronuclear) [Tetrahymena thermophila SB210]|uniref:Transmembrane protein, putative n=1 Tax=Tetrahymena thermophila (strain SB210) TaxID=312017 RepID=W7XFA3_TETTS|nr:transmembrane protein, putative [Tetrahymena thermophila SB210]EWS75508.1 transmembrane protein, putative [Tetrahymena thermophila SB210]|eukprot:XP_012651977.1 transmembrane protein, putative [Tetrahymena thermophila SB210]